MDTDTLISDISQYVTSQLPPNDPSHNPSHVFRVLNLAHKILSAERSNPSVNIPYNDRIVILAALLHDIGDKKYLSPCELTGQMVNPESTVYDILVSRGADSILAQRVQTIVSHVSYTNEAADGREVRKLISKEGGYPELGIVQDADRLDSLGAVGIGRCFAYLGGRAADMERKKGRKGSEDTDVDVYLGGDRDKGREGEGEGEVKRALELGDAFAHFQETLLKLEGMMKTESGREMARTRSARIREFQRWWIEETQE